jgi:2-dehydro-3-deoxygalactonokinase
VTARSAAFAAADWGTTRLRLWLIDADGGVLGEFRSDEGMATAAARGFATILEEGLAQLGAPPGLPVMVCGMAGARQGWVEAPYVALPADLSELAGRAIEVPGLPRRVLILPGLAAAASQEAADVMRGEETQLLGIADALGASPVTVVMPGTHCKWVACEGGVVTGFRTFMTGELFALLSRQSILRHATGDAAADPGDAAFAEAVRAVIDDPSALASGLFGIRAAGLVFGTGQAPSASRLSGLLIGAEIAAMRDRADRVVLLAQGVLGKLYAAALEAGGVGFETVDADAASRSGLFQAARKAGLTGDQATRAGAKPA